MSEDPEKTRTTLRSGATRLIKPERADALEPLETRVTNKREPGDEGDAADAGTDARTTHKRDLESGADSGASQLSHKTTFKREHVPDLLPVSEARSTRLLLGQTASPSIEIEIGSVIKKRFEIVEELGRGGMGVVFKARDLRKVEAHDPDPYLAIKILIGDMADFDLGFIALQREGKHAQTLNHPNLVKVFDFDRDGQLVFLTMELLRGDSLQSRLRDDRVRPMSPEARLKIARGVIAGLAYAHSRKIVHADIKPSNIFVCEGGEAKILDFGIARAAERDTVFDADDIGALTVDYASAEMLAGERPQPADDVYALGCLLFRLYAGVHPYNRQPADVAMLENMRAVFPRNLSRVQARALRRAIAFKRAERFADAGELGRAFDAYDWQRFARNAGIVAVLLGLVGWTAHDWLMSQWSALRLAPEARAEVEADLAEAESNLGRQYWEDAAVRYVDVLRLDPWNRAARTGLAEVVAGLQQGVDEGELTDAVSIVRERTGCADATVPCPAWAERILTPPGRAD